MVQSSAKDYTDSLILLPMQIQSSLLWGSTCAAAARAAPAEQCEYRQQIV